MDQVFTVYQTLLECDDFISNNEACLKNLHKELKCQENRFQEILDQGHQLDEQIASLETLCKPIAEQITSIKESLHCYKTFQEQNFRAGNRKLSSLNTEFHPRIFPVVACSEAKEHDTVLLMARKNDILNMKTLVTSQKHNSEIMSRQLSVITLDSLEMCSSAKAARTLYKNWLSLLSDSTKRVQSLQQRFLLCEKNFSAIEDTLDNRTKTSISHLTAQLETCRLKLKQFSLPYCSTKWPPAVYRQIGALQTAVSTQWEKVTSLHGCAEEGGEVVEVLDRLVHQTSLNLSSKLEAEAVQFGNEGMLSELLRLTSERNLQRANYSTRFQMLDLKLKELSKGEDQLRKSGERLDNQLNSYSVLLQMSRIERIVQSARETFHSFIEYSSQLTKSSIDDMRQKIAVAKEQNLSYERKILNLEEEFEAMQLKVVFTERREKNMLAEFEENLSRMREDYLRSWLNQRLRSLKMERIDFHRKDMEVLEAKLLEKDRLFQEKISTQQKDFATVKEKLLSKNQEIKTAIDEYLSKDEVHSKKRMRKSNEDLPVHRIVARMRNISGSG